ILIFFFQAEDGIRDFHVTGVQTCALPIWHPDTARRRPAAFPVPPGVVVRGPPSTRAQPWVGTGRRVRRMLTSLASRERYSRSNRSVERRVGEGCRRQWLYSLTYSTILEVH